MSSIAIENLCNPILARAKGCENERKILNFLLKEKYSLSSILSQVLGLKSRTSIWKILKRMENKGFIKQHRVNMFRTLWGITNEGLHNAQSEQESITDWQYFEPSKVSPITLDHTLNIQQIHAYCVNLGLNFITGRELGSRAASDKIPDGIIQIGNKKIAIEMERHVKSKRRYDAVIYNYLKLIKSGEYHSVLYVSDTPQKTQQIKKAITSLQKITMKINGQNKSLQINPDVHFSYFDFLCVIDVFSYLNDMLLKLKI